MKVVTISDTHSRHGWIYQLSEGESLDNIETVYHIQGTINASGGVFLPCDIDLLIHAGDMSMMGTETEIEQFLKWYSSLRAKYKVLIAGNHDFLFEKQRMIAKDLLAKYPDIIYLETEEVVIEGIKIYGEPRQPWFHSWAFNVERGEAIKRYWDAIPEDVNILVTHGPPKGILDMTMSGENVGCEDLLYRLPYLEQLKLVVFGHIHEHAGCELINGVIGKRLSDWVKVHYGSDVSFNLFQDCFNISEWRTAIDIDDVFSTSETADVGNKNKGDYLGAYAGKGIGFGKGGFTFKAPTHGFVFVMSCIVPITNIFQGNDPTLYAIDNDTIPHPEFDALGYEFTPKGVFLSDNFLLGEKDDLNLTNGGFGWVPRYTGFKVKKNIVNGDMCCGYYKRDLLPYFNDRLILSHSASLTPITDDKAVS